jgi:hypothetical protein
MIEHYLGYKKDDIYYLTRCTHSGYDTTYELTVLDLLHDFGFERFEETFSDIVWLSKKERNKFLSDDIEYFDLKYDGKGRFLNSLWLQGCIEKVYEDIKSHKMRRCELNDPRLKVIDYKNGKLKLYLSNYDDIDIMEREWEKVIIANMDDRCIDIYDREKEGNTFPEKLYRRVNEDGIIE